MNSLTSTGCITTIILSFANVGPLSDRPETFCPRFETCPKLKAKFAWLIRTPITRLVPQSRPQARRAYLLLKIRSCLDFVRRPSKLFSTENPIEHLRYGTRRRPSVAMPPGPWGRFLIRKILEPSRSPIREERKVSARYRTETLVALAASKFAMQCHLKKNLRASAPKVLDLLR